MARSAEELKKLILDGTIQVFNDKGLKFTMDDLARKLSISKKTIYTVFTDKEALFFEMVDYCFDSIKESERLVFDNRDLDVVEKIRKILIVMPEPYENIDFRNLMTLKDDYPQIYKKVAERIESGWEPTLTLLEQGIQEGKIRNISLPILRTMIESTFEAYLTRDVLEKNGISYREGLNGLLDIIMHGICVEN